jgi:hypothetical protein
MIVEINESLDTYFDTADATTTALRQEDGPILRLLHDFHRYFAKTLWRDTSGVPPVAAFLSMNAFMTYLAGVRVAMSGHVVAVFPVLRTALESACYAYLIARTPDLAAVWTDRHKGDAERKACRATFTGAVAAVAKDVEREQPGGGDWLREAYDTAIDFGGHPNIKSVFGHVQAQEASETDPFHRFSLVGLYGTGHGETLRGLIACADFALAIAVLLTRVLERPDEQHQAELHALNEHKNAVADELMAGRIG